MIPESVLQQIQDRVDIVEIVSAFVPLKRAGRSFKACCPFHHEKSPSFMVNPEKQIYHCFGCGVGGNVFSFLMKIERKDFPETVEALAERVGVEIPKDRTIATDQARKQEALGAANQAALEWFEKTLAESPASEAARAYLKKRGLDAAAMKEFRVGFAPDSWDGLLTGLKSRFPEDQLQEAGLALPGKNGGAYDRFRGRVMFPILDSKGACVAFGGRVMDGSEPKYLNSPETALYVKGRVLYGLHHGRKAIREEDAAIVVEGYMDVIACWQAGVKNVVASCGTALTNEQARLIKRNTSNVFMLYDADKAGEMATIRGLEIFLEEGLEVKIVRLPEGHDPDSYLREHGGTDFRAELAGAKTLFEYKVELLKKKHDVRSVDGKVKIANEMVPLLNKVKNEIQRSAWITELARDLGLPEESIANEMRKKGDSKPASRFEPFVALATSRPAASAPAVERMLLALLLEDARFIEGAREALRAEDFTHPAIRRVAKRLLEEPGDALPVAQRMTQYQDDIEALAVLSEAGAEAERIMDRDKSFEDCVAAIRRLRVGIERRGIQDEMLNAEREGDKNRVRKLIYDLEQLNKKEREIHGKK